MEGQPPPSRVTVPCGGSHHPWLHTCRPCVTIPPCLSTWERVPHARSACASVLDPEGSSKYTLTGDVAATLARRHARCRECRVLQDTSDGRQDQVKVTAEGQHARTVRTHTHFDLHTGASLLLLSVGGMQAPPFFFSLCAAYSSASSDHRQLWSPPG